MCCAPASRCSTSCSASTRFPRPEVKTQASEFRTVNGGNAANAAVAIAHLGARTSFAGPLGGPAGTDAVGDTMLTLSARENIACVDCPRVDGITSSHIGDLDRQARRARDRELSRRRADGGAAARCGGARRRCGCGDRGQPFSRLRARHLRGRAEARHSGGARRRRAAPGQQCAAHAGVARDLFRRRTARNRRHRPSRARPDRHQQTDQGVRRGHRRRERRAVALETANCGRCRHSRSTWSTRSARATRSTARSR